MIKSYWFVIHNAWNHIIIKADFILSLHEKLYSDVFYMAVSVTNYSLLETKDYIWLNLSPQSSAQNLGHEDSQILIDKWEKV